MRNAAIGGRLRQAPHWAEAGRGADDTQVPIGVSPGQRRPPMGHALVGARGKAETRASRESRPGSGRAPVRLHREQEGRQGRRAQPDPTAAQGRHPRASGLRTSRLRLRDYRAAGSCRPAVCRPEGRSGARFNARASRGGSKTGPVGEILPDATCCHFPSARKTGTHALHKQPSFYRFEEHGPSRGAHGTAR